MVWKSVLKTFATMGRTCSAPGCKSGYYPQPPGAPKISMHVFPKDSEMRQKWIRAIHREENPTSAKK